jgi:hypothetical protein
MGVKEHDETLEALSRAEKALRDARDELERSGRGDESDDAVTAFAATVREVLGDRPLSVEAARRAALVAAASEVWSDELGPLLSSSQVRELLGAVSRQRVAELLRGRRLIGLRDSGGRRRFPGFQFADGRPVESLIAAFWAVADGAVDEWTAAAWCVAPDAALDGRSPAQWAVLGGDPDRLARVARQDAARLAQ